MRLSTILRLSRSCGPVLLCGSASAQQGGMTVGFSQSHYEIPAGQDLTAPVLMEPKPDAGLFSYGLICTLSGSNGLTGVLTLLPEPGLAFDGINGPGPRGAQSAAGSFSVKGSTDFFDPAKPDHSEARFATLVSSGLPGGEYLLKLAPHNTLGPTESIFVDGASRSLDALLTFGEATVTVISKPEGVLSSAGPLTPQRQTGLLVQEIVVGNTGRVAAVFRVLVTGLPPGAELWNRTGLLDGIPYVDLPSTLDPGQSMRLILEYRAQDRATVPSPRFEITAAGAPAGQPSGTAVNIQPRASLAGGEILLEFDSEAGRTYHIQYSSDPAGGWSTSFPGIQGTGNRIQWIDNGPPKTAAHPSSATARFYRVLGK